MQPDQPPYSFHSLWKLGTSPQRAIELLNHKVVQDGIDRQRPWRQMRPIARDAGLDPAEVWQAVKVRRQLGFKHVAVAAENGSPFGWNRLGMLDQTLHDIDLAVGGGGAAAFDSDDGVLQDPDTKVRFKIRSLMDEAMESSIMEGAAVTRDKARELLLSGRSPGNKHEKMVVNNYLAMQRVKQLVDEPLTPEMLIDLQRILTQGTFDPGEEHKQGRFRRPDEPVRVVDERTNDDVFFPPPAEHLSARLKSLCDFANGNHVGETFIHPLLKACMLHFFVGYEHPFCDGNGRTARAVFYWFTLRSGYHVFEYLVISEIIRKAWSRYAQAYRNTEEDDNDLTYFLDFHVDVIRQSVDRLKRHIERESRQIKLSMRLVTTNKQLNLRQRLLLEHALRHNRTAYTVNAHARSYSIALATARSDLTGLVKAGFFTTSKSGHAPTYHLSPKGLARLVRKLE